VYGTISASIRSHYLDIFPPLIEGNLKGIHHVLDPRILGDIFALSVVSPDFVGVFQDV
jgi:hypothetical protein